MLSTQTACVWVGAALSEGAACGATLVLLTARRAHRWSWRAGALFRLCTHGDPGVQRQANGAAAWCASLGPLVIASTSLQHFAGGRGGSSINPPVAGVICAAFELCDASSGSWHAATARLNADASALVLEALGAPAGAVANATSNGYAVWPQVSLYAAASALPAYPWRSPVAASPP